MSTYIEFKLLTTLNKLSSPRTANLCGLTVYFFRQDIRSPAKFIPTSTLTQQTTLAQDLAPEGVAISEDNSLAYITLQVWFILFI